MKSKIVTTVFLIVIILSFVKCKHSDISIDRIYFHYEHSLRIPYHKVEIINRIPEKINEIPVENIKNNMGKIELDGSVWIIEFGNVDSLRKIEIWSPDSDTEERKLKEFIEASRLIVKSSSLNVDEILKE